MKKNIMLVAVCMLSIIAFSCKKESLSPGTFKLGESFELSLANPSADADDLSIYYINIEEDSRCPNNAVCIWEGRAVINFEFVAGRNSHNVQLIDRVGFPEMAKDTIEKYIIHLESVDPYPENNVTLEEEDYRFTLKITVL
jgi:hypothetical protein